MAGPLVALPALLAGCGAVAGVPLPPTAAGARSAAVSEGTPAPPPDLSSGRCDCPVTPTVEDTPPRDPNADAFGSGPWHVAEDRTIWAAAFPLVAGADGNKVIWIRPAGTELEIEGRRIDGDSPPLRAEIPCCYPTGFQVTGLYFPTGGCWEVTATAGDRRLRFVVEVAS